ncbi:MAP7 domain-containing protein 1 isoform X1 [Drosophila subobscura]|uniref:MAP7 domain-containing protein 1 isoform X1 n=1 Tax=Drosophila subobscura TaxID=7241 RepID=UPI00155A2E7D|nr:MAP7 domain-containing protein 1 isoform X1 [Drosophila subobscura]
MLETKSISALAFTETPRKRKRETSGCVPLPQPLPQQQQQQPLNSDAKVQQEAAATAVTESCFTNAAFSSTPKKLIGRRRLAKENCNPFPCLEFKSIAELAQQQQQQQKEQQQKEQPSNPFEVVRQPCKKKKREIACFENPGLNLELPEKQFNPYEVIRCIATPNKGFVNAALNVRGSDAPASRNPFEIHRQSEISALASNPAGVANPALAEEPPSLLLEPTSLKIGLPFVPNVGCRIDFHGMSLAQLTPSKLLAEKLVFSPVPGPGPEDVAGAVAGPKRSLGAISEESSTMDIGKELDRYQLELENSINEAKLRKKAGVLLESEETQETLTVVQERQEGALVERQLVCTRRRTLTEICEVPEEQKEEEQQQQEEEEQQQQPEEEQLDPEPDAAEADVAYASESDEEDFKAPARFVRAYRPAAASKESLQSIGSSKSGKSLDKPPTSGHGMKNMIRKSIRRLMHPMESSGTGSHSPEKPHNNIMQSIRHSLRRRPQKEVPLHEEQSEPDEEQLRAHPAEISIVDSSERTMKLRSSIAQTEYMTIEQLTNERKHTLRNSIRRSTREVLRHVFHKSHDAYATAK